MKIVNPYDPPKAKVADVEEALPKRPLTVTLALAILWIPLGIWMLGSLGQMTSFTGEVTPGMISYVAYLAALVIVPAWLLLKMGRACGWARIALIVLYGLDILFRIYLLSFDSTLDIVVGILAPATFQAIGFVLLFLPVSNAWFRARR